jgi:hypothetical protein
MVHSGFGPTVDNEVVFPDNSVLAKEGKFIKVVSQSSPSTV